ncbi:TPA: hypothetical protein ACGWER_001722 [Streptococcus agalactiae]|nr:hypothetical protein [Streptococcus agalactiae]HEO2267371.1 hypothetical protein [Streptococcus agalactiae]HEO7770455.1 hypothetical protein [Streptococcus agalactiae]
MYTGELIALIGFSYLGICILSVMVRETGRFFKKLMRAIAFAYLDDYNDYQERHRRV